MARKKIQHLQLSSKTAMNKIYQCDECKKTFKGSEIVLHPHHDNFQMLGMMIYLVENNKKTIIASGNTSALPKENKYSTMHCPYCDMVHLFGFDRVQEMQ